MEIYILFKRALAKGTHRAISLSLSLWFVNLLDTHQYNEYNKGPLSPMPCYTMCSTKTQNRYGFRMGHYYK